MRIRFLLPFICLLTVSAGLNARAMETEGVTAKEETGLLFGTVIEKRDDSLILQGFDEDEGLFFTRPVYLTETTRWEQGSRLEDILIGDRVEVEYEMDGEKAVARRIDEEKIEGIH